MAADRLRDALAQFMNDAPASARVRSEIKDSWRRSLQAGLLPDRFDVPFEAAVDSDAPLVRAARPVLDGLVEDLTGMSVSVVLTDHQGHVIDRRVRQRSLRTDLDGISLDTGFVYAERRIGTNAIGTALVQRAASMVVGPEHFADAFTYMACAAVPIFDPESGRMSGVIDLTCRASHASKLMLSLARRAAREIEQRLVDDKRVAERLLLQHFLQKRRGAKGPLLFVNRQQMITNAAADRIVQPADAQLVWDQVTRALANDRLDASELVLRDGEPMVMQCEAVRDGGALVGALVQLRPRTGLAVPDVSSHGELTNTEHSVAALATDGLTNREIGERLFMSRYTVDTHIRSIYRKLGVNSRVALAHAYKEPS
ncbi:MAG TPA: LuxR C-terminal-related transcriptional regulator [Acidimicrobiales bacterium]|nr:LuxR C-terminal-related transcriptional regulator [Acidimicrobiales bacterium]